MDSLATTLALSDAWHDFNKYGCDPTSIKDGIQIFNESVIKTYLDSSRPNEDAVLGAISDTSIRNIIDAAPDTISQFDTKTKMEFISKVILLNTTEDGDIKRPAKEISDSANLPQSFGVIVDFNQHGILDRFTNGDSTGKTCYYLYTSETENDPAGKTSMKDSVFSLTKNEKGIRLIYCEQVGGDPIVYTGGKSFNPGEHDYKLDFYSKYTLTLSPIQRITTLGIGKKTTVNLTISNDLNTLVHQIPDAKKSNSIKSIVSEFLKKIISSEWTNARKFNAHAGWIQKRSGDWLQVLACLDIHNRKFKPELPSETPIFFVTHDRVALAYALLMGVNTIFIKADHRIVVFTRKDISTQDINEIYKKQIESITDGPNVYKWLKEFKEMRNDRLVHHQEALEKSKTLRDIFKAMLHYTHSYLEIQNVDDLILALSRFNGEDTKTEDSKVIAAYVAAVSIIKVHFKPYFRKPFDTNFEAKDLFKTLDRNLNPYKIIRLVIGNTGNIDSDSFLSYINKLPNEDETMKKFKDILQNYTPTNDTEKELHKTSKFFFGLATFMASITTDISAVVDANSYNDDPNNDERNHNPDQADELSTAGRRRTRRGGWKLGSRYSPSGGSTVIFPIKQTTQVWVFAHILKPPTLLQTLLQTFGLFNIPRFKDISVINGVITETGEDPSQVQSGGAQTNEHLFPIYAMLDAFTPNISQRLEGSMDMEHYNRYYTFLEALKKRSEVLTDPSQKDLIATALREVLFISAQSDTGRASILKCIGDTEENYAITASMTTTFSTYICGELPSYTAEYETGIDKLLSDQTVKDIIGGSWKDSASFRKEMTVDELDTSVEKLKLELVSLLTIVDAVKPVPEEVPLKIPQRQIEDVGDPTAVGARRRRTRRLTKDFLQTTRHQSIKMSSRRHSLSGNALNR